MSFWFRKYFPYLELKALFQLNKAVALGLKFIQVLLVGTDEKVEKGTE